MSDARHLSAERIEEILNAKEERHGLVAVSDYDALVLAYKEQDAEIARLRAEAEKYKVFYEMNANLAKGHARQLQQAHAERDALVAALRRGGAERDDGVWHRYTCLDNPCSVLCTAQREALTHMGETEVSDADANTG